MCDYSLHHVKSRPANIGDKLIIRNFNTGTRGFASPNDLTIAVCILPGTELAFSEDVKWAPFSLLSWRVKVIEWFPHLPPKLPVLCRGELVIMTDPSTCLPRIH